MGRTTQWDSGYIPWQWKQQSRYRVKVVEVQARDGNQRGPNSFDDSETTWLNKDTCINSTPMPYIDIITPSNKEVGKDVRFTGHGIMLGWQQN
jgi:hypothetical protein